MSSTSQESIRIPLPDPDGLRQRGTTARRLTEALGSISPSRMT